MPLRSTNRPPFPVVLLALTAFAAGAVAERLGLLPGAEPPRAVRSDMGIFWQVWRLIHANYVDRAHIDDRHLIQKATVGMVNALGDLGHTAYLTKDEWERAEASLEGHFEGVGARLGLRQRRPYIVSTMPGSPARKAGLKPGDFLIAVDGKDVQNMPVEQIVQHVRGQAGSDVRLTVLREGHPGLLDIVVTRARMENPEVEWHMVPGTSIAHVALREFGTQADKELKAALAQARAQGARGLVFDLRGNPGGIKDQAVAVASEFLRPGEVVFVEEDAQGNKSPVPVEQGGGAAGDLPVVVLIDEGTGSSAEIVAGALQDYNRAKLVGARTIGTGTVLKPFALRDGSVLLLAIAKWLTPKGRQIWHEGIAPDEEVILPAGVQPLLPDEEAGMDAKALAASKDQQLRRAVELLGKQLK